MKRAIVVAAVLVLAGCGGTDPGYCSAAPGTACFDAHLGVNLHTPLPPMAGDTTTTRLVDGEPECGPGAIRYVGGDPSGRNFVECLWLCGTYQGQPRYIDISFWRIGTEPWSPPDLCVDAGPYASRCP